MTPFGFPVVPDVYRTNSGSVASIASGSHQSSAFAIASCHQMSRPSFIGTGSFIRWNTTTCFTMDRSAIASSTAFFSGTTLPRRYPPSVVTRMWESASSKRSWTAFELKPPKITLWIAPIRAHASIAIGSSGIIGM